jgi:hypothetical protein
LKQPCHDAALFLMRKSSGNLTFLQGFEESSRSDDLRPPWRFRSGRSLSPVTTYLRRLEKPRADIHANVYVRPRGLPNCSNPLACKPSHGIVRHLVRFSVDVATSSPPCNRILDQSLRAFCKAGRIVSASTLVDTNLLPAPAAVQHIDRKPGNTRLIDLACLHTASRVGFRVPTNTLGTPLATKPSPALGRGEPNPTCHQPSNAQTGVVTVICEAQ